MNPFAFLVLIRDLILIVAANKHVSPYVQSTNHNKMSIEWDDASSKMARFGMHLDDEEEDYQVIQVIENSLNRNRQHRHPKLKRIIQKSQ